MAGAYYHRSVDYFAGVLTGYMISGPSCVFINLNNSFLKFEENYFDCRDDYICINDWISRKYEYSRFTVVKFEKNKKSYLLKIVKLRRVYVDFLSH